MTVTLGRWLHETLDGPGELGAVLAGLAAAAGEISQALARSALGPPAGRGARGAALRAVARAIVVDRCAPGWPLAAVSTVAQEGPPPLLAAQPGGPLLLAVDPLEGAAEAEANAPAGTIFSILRRAGTGPVTAADFLAPGRAPICAGYALHGASTVLVLTLGRGVAGFTLDRERGELVLTHPAPSIPATPALAGDVADERFWEPPARRYLEECRAGRGGPRGLDFEFRWGGSVAAEVHRLLVRGGVLLCPRDGKEPLRSGPLALLHQATPLAMIVEQAGGAASTGRERVLDLAPEGLHQRVPAFLGARGEVERIVRYHAEDASGLAAPRDAPFRSPLFGTRSLFTEP